LIRAVWSFEGGRLRPVRVEDVIGASQVDLEGCEAFRLILADGQTVRGSDFKLIGEPAAKTLEADSRSSILGQRFAGRQVTARLATDDGRLRVDWSAVLRDGANAIRQEFVFEASGASVAIKETAC